MSGSQRQKLEAPDLSTISPSDLNVGELFGDGKIKVQRGRLLSAACLQPLKVQKETLLPDYIYVRDEMNITFQRLLAKQRGERHVLIGSPGVGKSMVFFLTALYLAGYERKSVIYHRLTESEYPRVFVIQPGNDEQDGTVKISQYVHHRRDHYSIENVMDAAEAIGYEPDGDIWRYFIDGPKEKDVEQLKPMDIFFCTSGGYKTPKDEERRYVTIQIMSAWNELDLTCGLMGLAGVRLRSARKAYWYCGGRIRLALDYLRDSNGKARVEQWASLVAADVSRSAVAIAIGDADARTDTESKDRLRTMFRSPSGKPVQMVDSQYLLARLRARLETTDLRVAFNVARSLNSRTAMGCFYEEIAHKWFEKTRPRPITDFVRPEDVVAGLASVHQLTTALAYWVPSISNFANIDAAVVVTNRLHCIQYTIQSSHSFNIVSFEDFLTVVFQQIPAITSVAIVFAVPDASSFQDNHTDFECEGRTCSFEVVEMHIDSDAELTETATSGFSFLVSRGTDNGANRGLLSCSTSALAQQGY